MVLTDEIKNRMRKDIKLWLEKSHEVWLTISKYGIKATRDNCTEIISWLKTEYKINGKIELDGNMLRFNIEWEHQE